MNITVVGTGYVGLVAGSCFADMGHDVHCHDVNEQRIDRLCQGDIPFFEPGLADVVLRNTRDKRLHFTTDLSKALVNAHVCFIAVGTPPDEDGSADANYVYEAAKQIGENMHGALIVVVKSTVPVGTCKQVAMSIREALQSRNAAWECDVVSNPEFLREGKAVEDFMRPDRIVVGTSTNRASEVMARLYEPFVRNGHPLFFMGVPSAEMSKYAANAMLAARISLMNEFAQICEHVGADIQEVRRCVGADRRIGNSYLYAGAGFGGSCLPKDIRALTAIAKAVKCPSRILESVEQANDAQKILVAKKVCAYFNNHLNDLLLGVWGLAFKPMTDDIREAPALAVIRLLLAEGARVIAYDPEAQENTKQVFGDGRITFAANPYAAAKDVDALIIMTEWGVFRGIDLKRVKASMKNPAMFDGRNLYDPKEMRDMGFDYDCIGRPCSQ